MKNMKKILSLILVLVMLVSLFPAAALAEGEDETPAEENPAGVDVPGDPEPNEPKEPENPEDPDDPADPGDPVGVDVPGDPEPDETDPADEPDALPPEDEADLPEGVVASGTCGDNLSWSLSDSGVLSIYGTGPMTDYKLNTHPGWYSYGTDITSVVFGTGVTSVGNYAFHGGTTAANYPNLTWVAMSDTLTSVGSYAFYNCTALSDAALPSGLTTLKSYAFCNTALTEVTIPGGVTEVGEDAFRGCASLVSLTIEYGVTKLNSQAFLNCTALESVTIPGSCTGFGSAVFKGCSSLVNVTLPEGMTTLGYSMFANCSSFASITLPQSLTEVPYMAFYGCSAITEITIPAGVTSLGDSAFGNTGLTEITFLGDAPTSIHASAFQNVTATVYYPGGNATWTADVMQDYGGNLTWESLLQGYNLYLLGQQIDNAGLSGTVSSTVGDHTYTLNYRYDPNANTLHLSGEYCIPEDYTYDYLIWSIIDGLTIQMDSAVSLSTAYQSGQNVTFIRSTAPLTITGENKLSIYGSGNANCTGVYCRTLRFEDANVWIGRGVAYGLDGGDLSWDSSLTVRNSKLDVSGDTAAVYCFRSGVTLDGCWYIRPYGAIVDDSGIVCWSTGYTAPRVNVDTAEPYALAVDGVAVTDSNKNNILGTMDPIFSFDPATSTLAVGGSYQGSADQALIENHIDGLTILVDGDYCGLSTYSLASNYPGLIVSDVDLNIVSAIGTETLALNSYSGYYGPALHMIGNTTLTVNDVELLIDGFGYGLFGDEDDDSTLLILNKARLNLDTLSAGIRNFRGGVNLTGCGYVIPAYPVIQDGGLYYDTWVADGNGATLRPATKVQTAETVYDLVIDGVRVWSGNADDILADRPLGQGIFSYDPGSKTLTVHSGGYTQQTASLDSYRIRPVIDSSVDGLTILLDSEETVLISSLENYSSYVPLINSTGNLAIEGKNTYDTPVLKLSSSGSSIPYDGIHIADGTLLLKKVDLRIGEAGNLPKYGLKGDSNARALNIVKACVSITTMSSGAAAKGFSTGITLTDCEIVSKGVTVGISSFIQILDDATGVVISNEVYDLYIDGYKLYKDRLSMMGGTVIYDPETNVLTLNGSAGTFASSSLPYIENHIPGLTIYVEQGTTLTTTSTQTGHALIESDENLTITAADYGDVGVHRLVLDGGGTTNGIAMLGNCTLTVDHADLQISNVKIGMWGDLNVSTKLIIRSSWLDVDSTSWLFGAISSFRYGITLEHCEIRVPENYTIIDGTICNYEDGSSYSAKRVVIEPEEDYLAGYYLRLGDVRVNNGNKDDILGDGKASYDSETQTLTIVGDLSVPGPLEGGGIDLTLVINGSLSVGTSHEYNRGTQISGGSLTIDGPGSFSSAGLLEGICADDAIIINGGTVTATGDSELEDYAGLRSRYGDITVNGGEVNASGGYGIAAGDSLYTYFIPTDDVIVNGGQVTAHGAVSAIHYYNGTFTLGEYSYIADPADARSMDGDIYYLEDGWIPVIATDVVIEEYQTHIVSFDTQGHGTAPAAQTVAYGGTVTRPEDPTAEGWTFGGWYTDPACTAVYAFTTPVTADITLYAKWTQITYTVSFRMLDHGTAPAAQMVGHGDTATRPADPEAEGWIFGGWYTDLACTAEYDFSTPVTGNLTLFAKWTKASYTVTFDVQDHGTAPAAQRVGHGDTATRPEDPTAEGWSFGGWYTDPACTAAYHFSTPVTADITLYAKWTQNTYTVTFDVQGHGTAPAAQTVPHGDCAAEPEAPTAEGWSFEGWYLDADCTEPYTFTTPVTADLTLYAKWTQAYIPGDINGDGKLNNKDVTRLQKYLQGEEVEVNEAALDVNGDGKVNNKDLTRLQKYLKGDDVEIH